MRSKTALLLATLILLPALPVLAAESAFAPGPQLQSNTEAAPESMDSELVREEQRFSQFARQQVERMNETILGGRHSMRVKKCADGLYRASYKAIDLGEVVFHVRRAKHDPRYFVGDMVYKELILESVGQTAEACRKGSFAPVSTKANRIIYSSKRGGGWN
ncbi:MAG: hypothetical protein KKF77_16705 [Proteobacteria bacterium]|nr:hypothetical protein [Pseudomonadota bacterium]